MSMTTELIDRLRQHADLLKEMGSDPDGMVMNDYKEAIGTIILSEKLCDSQTEPCEDCISRQRALDTFGLSEKSRKYGGDHSGYDTIMLYEVQDALEALPSVTPQPKMGRWLESHIPESILCECSVCGFSCGAYSFNFCPNCGAKMKEVEE